MSTHAPQLTRTVQGSARNREARCPRCAAPAGSACRGLQGQALAGVHYQRTAANRRSFSAALHLFYAPLAPVVSSQLSGVSQ